MPLFARPQGARGGAAIAKALTETELRLLDLMGPGFGEGLPGVQVDPFNQVTFSYYYNVLMEMKVFQPLD